MKKKKETRGRKKGGKNRDKKTIREEREFKKKNKKRVGRPDGPGERGSRPPINIDFKVLEKLCQMQATEEEIAAWFDISIETLSTKIKQFYKITFLEYFKKHAGKGKISLRRTQFKHADKSVPMSIFLGKQYLNQRDKHEYSDVSEKELNQAIKEQLEKNNK